MASKTYNRLPVQLDLPSANAVKNYFFNYGSWKGVDQSKNFLAVDQETFADSKNVYVDGEGVLKSRPSIKQYSDLSTISDVQTFGDVLVLRFDRALYFCDKDCVVQANTSLTSDKCKLVLSDRKIFIFSETEFKYFDVETKSIHSAIDFVYVPKTTFDAVGVKTEIENKNILSTKETYVYLYNSDIGISVDAYGKEMTIEIQGEKYDILYTEESKDVISDVRFSFPSKEIYDTQVAVSNRNSYAVYSSTDNFVYYSASGRTFTSIFHLDASMGSMIGSLKFSQNGLYLIVATTSGLYIVSVLAEDARGEGGTPVKRFENFTNLLNSPDIGIKNLAGDFNWSTVEHAWYDFADWNDFALIVQYENASPWLFVQRLEDYHSSALNRITSPLSLRFDLSYNPNAKVTDILFRSESAEGVMSNGVISICRVEDGFGTMYVYDGGASLHWARYVDTDSGIVRKSAVKTLYDRVIFVAADETFGLAQLLLNKDSSSNGNYKSLGVDTTYEFFISDNGNKLLTTEGVYDFATGTLFSLIPGDGNILPVGFTGYIHYVRVDDLNADVYDLYSSLLTGTYELTYEKPGDFLPFVPDHVSVLDAFYVSKDNVLYISEYREDDNGNLLWYFSDLNKHTFDKPITGLHPISVSEMCVFLEDEIWYVSKSDAGYIVTKSKFESGLKTGGDVISSNDGSYTMFCTNDGFVALRYQNFVASTDQALNVLSNSIYTSITEYCKSPIRLFKYSFWIILYNGVDNVGFVFDIRNNSWWPVGSPKSVTKIVGIDDTILLLCDGNLYFLDKSYNLYFDDGKEVIDWFITSQKLHFGAINYCKHIVNLTLLSAMNVNAMIERSTCDLNILNYRKDVDVGDTKTLEYKVDTVQTFVQRLNHFKLNEFQYTLKTDHDNAIQFPLGLSSITIKYKITGQVR